MDELIIKNVIQEAELHNFKKIRSNQKNVELRYDSKIKENFIYLYPKNSAEQQKRSIEERVLESILLNPDDFLVEDLKIIFPNNKRWFRKGSNMRRFSKSKDSTSRQGIKIKITSQRMLNQLFKYAVSVFERDGVESKEILEGIICERIDQDCTISDTEKKSLKKSRIGQGNFRNNVLRVEPICRLTGLSIPEFLVASHIKPWRNSNNQERLDGYNGLMLSPHVDKLFDQGYITFLPDGELEISSSLEHNILMSWHLDQCCLGYKKRLTEQQEFYMSYHRKYVFRK